MVRMELKLARIRKGLSQNEVAKHLKKGGAGYSLIELGKRNLKLEDAKILKDLLEIEISDM